MGDLKDYDDKIVHIIIFNIAFVLLINNPNIILKNNGIFSIILTVPVLYFPIYVFKNIMPREWKFIVLYPKKELHRFSSDLFTKLRTNKLDYDKNLIDLDLILSKYGIPEGATEEDKLWYSIYGKYRYDKKIYQQNKRFLFCRDSTIVILIITPLFSIITLFIGFSYLIPTIIILGICEFIFFWKCARRENKDLALYVLQEETTHLKNYKKHNSNIIITIANYNT